MKAAHERRRNFVADKRSEGREAALRHYDLLAECEVLQDEASERVKKAKKGPETQTAETRTWLSVIADGGLEICAILFISQGNAAAHRDTTGARAKR